MIKLVGIVNVTPDSFSDGGRHFTAQDALLGVKTLIAQGADVLDIGAESTRPGAVALSADEEWARLEPVLAELPERAVFSLDTRHAVNAQRAIERVDWINDVSGFGEAMIEAVAASDCTLVLMHSLSVPADKNIVLPEGVDVMQVLLDFAGEKLAMLAKAGIGKERVIFDPGLGFGKTAKQSMAIVHDVGKLRALGVPLFIGHSRKSFLVEVDADRDKATLEVSKWLVSKQVEYLRVHDVVSHRGIV